ncbi:MAG: outer membrane protein assembly factor BamE [Thiobacillaceae bacterium]|nr:outer membrane protein assembly factor BamE [Thiobacillaceae bacterium]MDW8323246.1 outer membrane protein assembly factor BamE [Burkholderiales bacterium]
MYKLIAASVLTLAAAVAGCGTQAPQGWLSPYRLDIPQGNEVTQAMLDQLKPGMTAAQVRYILGTPLIVDPFHKERWDYVLRVEKGGRVVARQRLTVHFRDGRLQGVETDKPGGSTP